MINMICPMCRKHPVILVVEKAKTIINDKEIEYIKNSCFCPSLGENDENAYFVTPGMMAENVKRAHDAYLTEFIR